MKVKFTFENFETDQEAGYLVISDDGTMKLSPEANEVIELPLFVWRPVELPETMVGLKGRFIDKCLLKTPEDILAFLRILSLNFKSDGFDIKSYQVIGGEV